MNAIIILKSFQNLTTQCRTVEIGPLYDMVTWYGIK